MSRIAEVLTSGLGFTLITDRSVKSTVRPRMMSRLIRSLSILVFAAMAGQVHAFDAPAPPDPKTMEWTIAQANYQLPVLDVKDTKLSRIIEMLDRGDRSPGFYLNIDKSEVEPRLNKEVTFREVNVTWLKVLAKVADAIEADIVVLPGIFKLVPRKDTTPAGVKKEANQGNAGQSASRPESKSEGGDKPQP